jgi:hypothetical protein
MFLSDALSPTLKCDPTYPPSAPSSCHTPPDDGKRVEGFSLAQARVVVQEGSLLRDYWGCVQRGWRNNGWIHTPPPSANQLLLATFFVRFFVVAFLCVLG